MRRVLSILCSLSVMASIATAESLFQISVVAEGQTYNDSFDSAEAVIDAFDGVNLEDKITSYNDFSVATASMNFRGIPITLAYESTGTALRLQVPETGLDRTFTGATRDESEQQLEDFFKSQGQAEVTKILQALARKTVTDPIAGNPNSLMSTQISSDFDNAFNDEEPLQPRAGSTRAAKNSLNVGANYTRLRGGSFTSEKISVPLGYTFYSKNNARRKVNFRLPVSRVEVAGSQAFHVGAGLSLAIPTTGRLVTTPAINYGLSGSEDFGSGAQMVSGSLSNAFSFETFGLQNTFGNMIGVFETLKLKIGDFEIDPDLTIIPFVNGLKTTIPAGKLLKRSDISIYVIDTHYFGDDLAVQHMDEFGIGISLFRRATLGVNYLYSSESKGVRFGFNFRF